MSNPHVLATKDGIEVLIAILLSRGNMCPECGHGTRVTSKNWAKCKNCGNRVARTQNGFALMNEERSGK